MIQQTDFDKRFEHLSNSVFYCYKLHISVSRLQFHSKITTVLTIYKAIMRSKDVKILILCFGIQLLLLFEYTSHIGIININGNEFDNRGIMFDGKYLGQIHESNLLFNALIRLGLIVKILCKVDVSILNIFIPDHDIKNTDKLESCPIYNVNEKLIIYSSIRLCYVNILVSSDLRNNVSNSIIQKSLKPIYDITQLYNYVLVTRIVFNSFKTIVVVIINMDNSCVLIATQYLQQRIFVLKEKKVDVCIIILKRMFYIRYEISNESRLKPTILFWLFLSINHYLSMIFCLNIIKIIECDNKLLFTKTTMLQYLNNSLYCLIFANIGLQIGNPFYDLNISSVMAELYNSILTHASINDYDANFNFKRNTITLCNYF